VLKSARARIALVARENVFVPQIDGVLAEEEMRGSSVTQHVSRVARMQGVRAWVNEQVRQTATTKPVVVDGRDIGTAVFPDADLKIFLVADPWERARRRLIQQFQRAPSDEEIAEETDRLVQRDSRDAQQSGQAPDAVLLDTTYLTQEEQVDRIVALARAVTQRGEGTSID
jgi:cytidylate kinase